MIEEDGWWGRGCEEYESKLAKSSRKARGILKLGEGSLQVALCGTSKNKQNQQNIFESGFRNLIERSVVPLAKLV